MFKLKSWQLNSGDINSIYLELVKRMSAITDLEKLLKPDLTDEEFLEVISEFYTYNKEQLNNDISNNLENLFSNSKVQSGVINTDFLIKRRGHSNIYLALRIYTTEPSIIKSSIYASKKYRIEELEELIKERKILIVEDTNRIDYSLFNIIRKSYFL